MFAIKSSYDVVVLCVICEMRGYVDGIEQGF